MGYSFSLFCPLVRWSAGPPVRWSAGPLGRWAELFLDDLDDPEHTAPRPAEQRHVRQLDQGHDHLQALFEQLMRAFLLRRLIVDPEQEQAHLVEPEDLGNVRSDVRRERGVR